MIIKYDDTDRLVIADLKERFDIDSDSSLINDIYNIFDILGVSDGYIAHQCMIELNKNRPSYNNYEFNENEFIKKLKENSKIELNNSGYVALSDAYIEIQACYFILFENKEKILSNDIEFAIGTIDRVYSTIGIIYSNLTRNGVFDKIQSLGGKSRANKYNSYKSEIFAEWERGKFHSYSKCARSFSDKFDLNPKTIESWLSKKYKKS